MSSAKELKMRLKSLTTHGSRCKLKMERRVVLSYPTLAFPGITSLHGYFTSSYFTSYFTSFSIRNNYFTLPLTCERCPMALIDSFHSQVWTRIPVVRPRSEMRLRLTQSIMPPWKCLSTPGRLKNCSKGLMICSKYRSCAIINK